MKAYLKIEDGEYPGITIKGERLILPEQVLTLHPSIFLCQEVEIEDPLLGYRKELSEVEQILGKALGYPWYKDDQENFPDTTEEDGVCTGDNSPVSLAMEIVKRYELAVCKRVAKSGEDGHE